MPIEFPKIPDLDETSWNFELMLNVLYLRQGPHNSDLFPKPSLLTPTLMATHKN